jgi:hypothetical protein
MPLFREAGYPSTEKRNYVSHAGELPMNAGPVKCPPRLPLVILLLTLMSPCDRLWSAQTDPFVGTWRIVLPRPYDATPSKNSEMRFVVEKGQLRMDFKFILPDGNTRSTVMVFQFDGQEHSFELTGETEHRKHTILSKRIDDHTIESQTNHDDGKEISTERYVVSPDGSELTLTQRGQRPDDTPFESIIRFVRQ